MSPTTKTEIEIFEFDENKTSTLIAIESLSWYEVLISMSETVNKVKKKNTRITNIIGIVAAKQTKKKTAIIVWNTKITRVMHIFTWTDYQAKKPELQRKL